jgi:hypothetical protein
LHDAPEYVIGDLIGPFKAAIGLDYKAFEAKLLEAIHRRFGLPPSLPERITMAIRWPIASLPTTRQRSWRASRRRSQPLFRRAARRARAVAQRCERSMPCRSPRPSQFLALRGAVRGSVARREPALFRRMRSGTGAATTDSNEDQ